MITDSMIRGIGMTSERTRRRLVERLAEQGIRDAGVLQVMMQVPRHLFVDEALASRAYEETSLPIGHGQTISQPYVVARMSELLMQAGGAPRRVLEVGTGCGYQTVVLSQLVAEVYSVERIEALLKQARRRFRQLSLDNIRTRHTDGAWGWEEHAPFDGILVAAASAAVPEPLLGQLAVGGRMVLPLGDSRQQRLAVITRTPRGYEQEDLDVVSFVPLVRGES